jgi:hypothetical protein
MMVVLDKITMAAACWSWGLGIMNISIVVYLAQPSSLDVLELVGKVGCAGWRGLQRHRAAQRRVACVDSGVGRLDVRHVENGLLEIFLTVCGSSALAPSCWVECHSAKQHRSSSPARLPGLGACLVSRRPSFVRPSRNDTRPPPDPYKACPD